MTQLTEQKSDIRVVHCIIDNIYSSGVRGAQNKIKTLLTEYEGPTDGPISHSRWE